MRRGQARRRKPCRGETCLARRIWKTTPLGTKPGSIRTPLAPATGQLLLEPLLVELPPLQAELLVPRLEELRRLGLECQPFGGSVFLVPSAPQCPWRARESRRLRRGARTGGRRRQRRLAWPRRLHRAGLPLRHPPWRGAHPGRDARLARRPARCRDYARLPSRQSAAAALHARRTHQGVRVVAPPTGSLNCRQRDGDAAVEFGEVDGEIDRRAPTLVHCELQGIVVVLADVDIDVALVVAGV